MFAQARNQKGKRPVIFVPGLLGSQLVNERTRQVVWPAFFRSSDDELDLPIGPDFLTRKDSLVATKAMLNPEGWKKVAGGLRYAPTTGKQ